LTYVIRIRMVFTLTRWQ